jgi:hypothetical protein
MRAEHKNLARSIYEGETMAQFFQRIRAGGGRKPLRSLKELAEEFGVKPQSLKMKMQHDPEGPKARYATGGNGTTPRNTWFEPEEVRRWWKQRSEQ